jgi:hypothetical protein
MRFFRHKVEPGDIKLPTYTEPLRYKRLIVKPDRFFYKDRMFSFAEIDQIGWRWKTLHKVGIGKQNDMTLRVWVRSLPKPIDISTTGWIYQYHFFRSIKSKHIELLSIYNYLRVIRPDLKPVRL